eukprot:4494946-Ditylum_brightwellii.AAC.1
MLNPTTSSPTTNMAEDKDCDAKACYDRVIPIVSSLAQIQAGIPINAARFFLRALTQLEYHMVTSYRVSDTGVYHMEKQPIYGL